MVLERKRRASNRQASQAGAEESAGAASSLTPPAQTQAPTGNDKFQQTPEFLAVINELNLHQDQQTKRQQEIREIERALTEKYGATNRLISYVTRFGHARAMISSADVAPLDTLLNSLGDAEQINVLLHSPGGDGTVVEKIVDMCRAHLIGQNIKLRLVVPNIAKSAATVFALGADEIIMGYCSELGPIDPQVPVNVSGIVHMISALAFVESRDQLLKDIAKATKAKEPTTGLLQQLAGLNIPFTFEMEDVIEFAAKTAETLLQKYMLRSRISDDKRRRRKARQITSKLLSKRLFPVHGQFINGATAKRELELEIDVLGRADPLWHKIWQYYIRCEIQMNMPIQPPMIKIKLYESANVSLVTQDTAN